MSQTAGGAALSYPLIRTEPILKEIVPAIAGYVPNDMVFEAKGGFYFTYFRGTSPEPAGGVLYVSPDFTTITPVVRHPSPRPTIFPWVLMGSPPPDYGIRSHPPAQG